MTPLEIVGILFLSCFISYLYSAIFGPPRLSDSNSVLVDVEGRWERMPDAEFQKSVKTACVFIGSDGKLHLDRTKEGSYYDSVMEEMK